jgi:ATP-dependent DNA helicase PIF1
MVEADLFDKLSKLGSILTKRPGKPFGGIQASETRLYQHTFLLSKIHVQVVVTGDFFQLPPVVKSGETKFAFEAECWPKVISRTFNLTKVFRQKDQGILFVLKNDQNTDSAARIR